MTSKVTLDVLGLRSRPNEPALPTVSKRRFVACQSLVHRWQRRLPPLRGGDVEVTCKLCELRVSTLRALRPVRRKRKLARASGLGV